MKAQEIMQKARNLGKCIPAFNVPHLPMVRPIAGAIADENSTAMIQIARVEWEKFQARSLDYEKLLERALKAGYESVMIDGSRLPLEENIRVTAEAAAMAHEAGVPCEAELGAVMGHEKEKMPPYEEIFSRKMGFTKLEEAKRFVLESRCDWLSVAVGNIHGQIAEAVRNQKKPEARLDVGHIGAIYQALGIPLVLHGGSGIRHSCVLEAVRAGITKINVGTEIRQTYEFALKESGNDISYAQEQVYRKVRAYISGYLYNTGLADDLK